MINIVIIGHVIPADRRRRKPKLEKCRRLGLPLIFVSMLEPVVASCRFIRIVYDCCLLVIVELAISIVQSRILNRVY